MLVINDEITLDLFDAEQELTRLESEHAIAVGNLQQPTVPFLQAVAKWLGRKGLDGVTLSGAWQVWRAVFMRIEQLRKEHARYADLAHWYGIDPYRLTDEQRVGLRANLGRVQAQEILNAGHFSPTDYKGVYSLTLLATGDKREAEKARAEAMERFVDAQIKKG